MKNRHLLFIAVALFAGWFLLRHRGLGPGLTGYDLGPKTVTGGLYGGGQ